MASSVPTLPLNAVEQSSLYDAYLIETLIQQMYTIFLDNVQDREIADVLHTWRNNRTQRIKQIANIYGTEAAVPRGFIQEDIYLGMPRLYSDTFYLKYIKHMMRNALPVYSTAYSEVTRDDVRKLFAEMLHELIAADDDITKLKLRKGVYERPPYIAPPQQIEFVKKEGFLADILGQYPLSAPAITALSFSAQANATGKALLLGFSQVTKDPALREYFLEGKQLANEFFNDLCKVLNDHDITVPPSYDSEVTESNQAPFSDQLMLNHILITIRAGIMSYAAGQGQALRPDITALYTSMAAKSLKYVEKGKHLALNKGWLEQPPTALRKKAISLT
jgi:spore coat protein CotF